MGWLFGQVWVLCAISFLAGAAVTWLVFGRRRRPPTPAEAPGRGWTPVPAWATGSESSSPPRPAQSPPPAPPPAGPAVDPALAALDVRQVVSARPPVGAGASATGALDILGVAGAGTDGLVPNIPMQSGPTDAADTDEPLDGGRT